MGVGKIERGGYYGYFTASKLHMSPVAEPDSRGKDRPGVPEGLRP